MPAGLSFPGGGQIWGGSEQTDLSRHLLAHGYLRRRDPILHLGLPLPGSLGASCVCPCLRLVAISFPDDQTEDTAVDGESFVRYIHGELFLVVGLIVVWVLGIQPNATPLALRRGFVGIRVDLNRRDRAMVIRCFVIVCSRAWVASLPLRPSPSFGGGNVGETDTLLVTVLLRQDRRGICCVNVDGAIIGFADELRRVRLHHGQSLFAKMLRLREQGMPSHERPDAVDDSRQNRVTRAQQP
ncbi:hypothetical protein TOPH_03967 [Tolypocladium ophioglossoides CBS 100239]|uniref:Uncharacterized protein n=1 Tax=Tolypocladium ophioglossoides (strain CBS 100239) TaxID=1163406 RepID=A0A0L0NAX6_TOLOC|nr:hypothetical protein TOPH_03967 [Tolypocladium ophioglossoides CBS 100239]